MTLERWKPGESKPGIPVRTWNKFCDTVVRVEGMIANSNAPGSAAPASLRAKAINRCRSVKDNSEKKVKLYDVVQLTYTYQSTAAGTDSLVPAYVPGSAGSMLAPITLTACTPGLFRSNAAVGIVMRGGDFGDVIEVAYAGLIWAPVLCRNRYHQYVAPLAFGGTSQPTQSLMSAAHGPIRIEYPGFPRSTSDVNANDHSHSMLLNLSPGRSSQVVMLDSPIPAAVWSDANKSLQFGEGVGIEVRTLPHQAPDGYLAPVTQHLRGATEYSGAGYQGEKEIKVAVANPFTTPIEVAASKAKIATVVDGLISNVDCTEIPYT